MPIRSLNFFRFLAALVIVIFHFGGEAYPFYLPSSVFLLDMAFCLVSFFFLLSGFVLTLSQYSRAELPKKRFYHNRFFRIYPVYFLALLAVVAVNYFCGRFNENQPFPYADLFRQLTLTQSFFPLKALELNFPGWSLSVETFLYLLFPFLLTRLKSLKTDMLVALCLVVWLITLFTNWFVIELLHFPEEVPAFFPLFHISSFMMGIGTGILHLRYRALWQQNQRVLVWVCAALIAFFAGLVYFDSPLIEYKRVGLCNVLFCVWMLLFSIESSPFKAVLNTKLMVFLGDISYGFYIWQFPVFLLVSFVLTKYSLMRLAGFYSYLAVLTLMASLSYVFIERPILRAFKKA